LPTICLILKKSGTSNEPKGTIKVSMARIPSSKNHFGKINFCR
jgi:hypothetical protein